MALSEKYVDGPPGHPVETVVERKAATAAEWGNSAPLALCAFALTTFLLSMVNAGLADSGIEPMVFGVALIFGGLTQFLAGLLQFRIGNTFGGVLFTGFGAFWLSLWAVVAFFIGEVPAAEVGHALGLFLFAWGAFSTIMWLVSFRTNVAVNVALLVLTVTFFVLSAGAYGGTTGLTRTGGYLGLIVAGMAAYIALAELLETNYQRQILPLWPLGKH